MVCECDTTANLYKLLSPDVYERMATLLESQIPILIVTASIILAGILIGLGRGLGYKKIERFGIEELTQALINAALFGSAAVLIATITEVGKSTAKACSTGVPIDELGCGIRTSLVPTLGGLFQETVGVLQILGYYQTLSLDFGYFSIRPLENLASVSDILSAQGANMQFLTMLININLQFIDFISVSALALLFSVGLLFRMFFATRRFGGFLLALAIGLYLIYPSFIMIFDNPYEETNQAYGIMQNITNNTAYGLVPIVDLNDNNAIAQRIDLLSGRISNATNQTNSTLNQSINLTAVDLTSDLTVAVQANSAALSALYFYLLVAPIFSLFLSVIFIKELGNILGGELGLFSLV